MQPPESEPSDERSSPEAPSNDLPAIEDAYAPDESGGQAVADDEPNLADMAIPVLESGLEEGGVESEAPNTEGPGTEESDDTSDTGGVATEPETDTDASGPAKPWTWEGEASAHKIVVELKRIEAEVRGLLETRDSKRKRKLGGTRRWMELTDDIIAWRYTGRMDEATLRHLEDLINRRHHLFRRLRFLAGTRPTWNS
jgi:hypothetical protein